MDSQRAIVKIEFSLCGIERKCEMHLNWDMDYSTHKRVLEFFSAAEREAHAAVRDAACAADVKALEVKNGNVA